MQGCRVQGQEVPADMLGELPDSAALLERPQALRERMAADGYVYLKGVLDKALVMAARQ